MCYSFKTSVISYSLGILSAIFAFATRQYIIGMLILFYCQMQMSEAMIWKGIDDDDISLNIAGTKYGRYLLPSHLFAIGLGYLVAVKLLEKKSLKPSHFIPVIVGIIFYVTIFLIPYRTGKYDSVTFPVDKSCIDKSCQNNANRLKWPYPHSWYIYGFILCIIFLLVFVKPISSKILVVSVFILSLILVWIIYPRSVGSVWCFFAAIAAPVLVIANYLIIRNKPDSEIMT